MWKRKAQYDNNSKSQMWLGFYSQPSTSVLGEAGVSVQDQCCIALLARGTARLWNTCPILYDSSCPVCQTRAVPNLLIWMSACSSHSTNRVMNTICPPSWHTSSNFVTNNRCLGFYSKSPYKSGSSVS